MNCVYRFGCLSPTGDSSRLIREQLRFALEYRRDVVIIERGRRHAMRAILSADAAVLEAEELWRVATKSDRKERRKDLSHARRMALANASEHVTEIEGLEKEISKNAYNHARCAWGTRLDINGAAASARSAGLYADDMVTPSDPAWPHWRGEGQIAIQLQKGLLTRDALRGADTRVRLRLNDRAGAESRRGKRPYGTMSFRVGSDGRAPIWAEVPILVDRAIPDAASWQWVRLSVRMEGPHEHWSCEITLDTNAPHPHSLDTSLAGAIAVELMWTPLDDGGIRVASWQDSRGERGLVDIPARMVNGIRKPDGIRAVRDVTLNDLRPRLARAIQESTDTLPAWLSRAASTMQFWKSPARFHDFVRMWRSVKCDAARPAYELLQAWEMRDYHLWEYEAGSRREAIRERRDLYRVFAARWSEQYRSVLVPDRNLSREARFGEDSDRRFTASPQELRDCLRKKFGPYSHDVPWRGPNGVIDTGDEDADVPLWLEYAIEWWRDEQNGVFAREEENAIKSGQKRVGVWTKRKAAKAAKSGAEEGARKAVSKCA